MPETVCEIRFREYLKWAEKAKTRFLTNSVPTHVPVEYWVNYYLGKFKSPEISGYDPIFFLWMPKDGWTEIWRFHSVDELNSFANNINRNAVLKENNYVYLEGPKNDYAEVLRFVSNGFRVKRIAICLKSEPYLNNVGIRTPIRVGLYNSSTDNFVEVRLSYPIGFYVKKHYVRINISGTLYEIGYFEHPDDFIVLVVTFDYVNGKLWVEVYHGAFLLFRYSIDFPVENYDIYYIDARANYYPDDINYISIDWVAISLEHVVFEDSGTDPNDPTWAPELPYEELYRFHDPSDLDALFNETNNCCIESNSCWNCGSEWCHRDTGLETWSYAYKHAVFAIKMSQLGTPAANQDILKTWSFKDGVHEKSIQLSMVYDKDLGKPVIIHSNGSFELEWDKWYIIRMTVEDTVENSLIEVWDASTKQKIAELTPTEWTPTYTKDFHVIELYCQNYVKTLIDWWGFTKWS